MFQALSMVNNQIQFEKNSLLDLNTNVFVHKAKTKRDFEKVFDVRWKGYKKYFKSRFEAIDRYDFAPNVTLLLAVDEHYNPLGTIRILDRTLGKIELDDFIDVSSFLNESEKACIHVNRFTIPRHPDSKLIKILLFKGVLKYCLMNQINTILKSARPSCARLYNFLHFENVGTPGEYIHPLLGNLEHCTYKLNIPEKQEVLKRENPLLHNFLFKKDFINIKIYDFFSASHSKVDYV